MTKTQGNGSIVQVEKDKPKGKCRKWQLRVPVGLDPRTGKYKTKTRRFTGTYTEAKAALRKFIKEIEDNEVHKRAGSTMLECAEDFMNRRIASGEFSDNTNELYTSFFKAINRHIGYADASTVDRKVIEKMYAAMRKGDTLSGRPASGTYLHQLHRTLSLLFDDLVTDGTVLVNPCKQMETPRNDTKERRALKPERIKSFMADLEVEEESDFGYYQAVSMGMRGGEICGLSWCDVDFVNDIVNIGHSFDRFGNLKEPKTKAGIRCLPMSSKVKEDFLKHKEAQKKYLQSISEKDGGPKKQTEETPVIVDEHGNRLKPHKFGAWWRRDRKSFDLDGWCLHELRHSYLSMLALEGVHPKVMQELAGHASSSITMEVYTHLNMDSKRAAAVAVEEALGKISLDDSSENAEPNGPNDAQNQSQEQFVPDSYQPTEVPNIRVIKCSPEQGKHKRKATG